MTHIKTEYRGPCLYRGKRLDNGEWVEGYYIPMSSGAKHFIYLPLEYVNEHKRVEIDPQTLSAWTGLEDKNGVKIFSGDVVSYKELIPSNNSIQKEIQGADFVYINDVGVIQWDSDGCDFMVCLSDSTRGLVTRGNQDIIKLGNIWDNPELFGGLDGE